MPNFNKTHYPDFFRFSDAHSHYLCTFTAEKQARSGGMFAGAKTRTFQLKEGALLYFDGKELKGCLTLEQAEIRFDGPEQLVIEMPPSGDPGFEMGKFEIDKRTLIWNPSRMPADYPKEEDWKVGAIATTEVHNALMMHRGFAFLKMKKYWYKRILKQDPAAYFNVESQTFDRCLALLKEMKEFIDDETNFFKAPKTCAAYNGGGLHPLVQWVYNKYSDAVWQFIETNPTPFNPYIPLYEELAPIFVKSCKLLPDSTDAVGEDKDDNDDELNDPTQAMARLMQIKATQEKTEEYLTGVDELIKWSMERYGPNLFLMQEQLTVANVYKVLQRPQEAYEHAQAAMKIFDDSEDQENHYFIKSTFVMGSGARKASLKMKISEYKTKAMNAALDAM